MDNVILDTSIFIAENFFAGTRIKSLLKIAEQGHINLFITEITKRELINNIRKSVLEAVAFHKRFKKSKESWVLRNGGEGLTSLFENLDSNELIQALENNIDNFISKGVIQVIDYRELNVRNIFDNYFESLPPFHNKGKKHEFPDAISLELINSYFNSAGLKGIVLTTDPDLLDCKISNIQIRGDYHVYLENKLVEYSKSMRIREIIDSVVIKNASDLKQVLVSWFKDKLDDETLYYDAVNMFNIYNVSVENILVQDFSHSIVEIENDLISVEVIADVAATVEVLTDDESVTYYDSDDRTYYYPNTRSKTLNETFKSSIILSVEIYSDEENDYDFEIESVNKDLKISFSDPDIEYY